MRLMLRGEGVKGNGNQTVVGARLSQLPTNIECVHKTDVLRTPKPGSQKSVFMGLSEGDLGRVFLTLALTWIPAKCKPSFTFCSKLASTLNAPYTHISSC